VLDLAPDGFQQFHDALYAEQPAEGGAGLTNDRLLDLAVAAGAPRDAANAAIVGLTYKGWTAKVTEAASKAGVTSTPTVIVNGTTLADHSPGALAAAVLQALTKGQG
jgi:protein-disulfide isomerase